MKNELNVRIFIALKPRKAFLKIVFFTAAALKTPAFLMSYLKAADLSNSKFTGAYFERCRFVSCKCIGMDMSGSIAKHVSFEMSNLQYCNFNKIKMTDVLFKNIDFTDSSMVEAKLSGFEAVKSRFIKNNFSKTMLASVDFTDSDFVAPTVSNPPIELKGAIITTFQAADLISLWGVIVKPL